MVVFYERGISITARARCCCREVGAGMISDWSSKTVISKLLLSLTTGLLLTVAMYSIANAQNQRAKSHMKSIHVSELNLNKVIGYLGHPLGEIVTIEGIAADGNDTRQKADTGELLLRVQGVNGKPLKREVILHFFPFQGVPIKNPSVGAKFRYIGYETGGFSGVPEKAFDYVPQAATTGHYFSTSFVVLRDERGSR